MTGLVCPGREIVRIDEGNGGELFWEALGGKTEYNNIDYMDRPILLPRLLMT